jgi:hypothetical protein
VRDTKVNPVSGLSDYVHHYKASAASNDSPSATKMIILAQELADLSKEQKNLLDLL